MTKAASSIACRAMNSAVCAYGIKVKTPQFIPPQPYFDAVGYQTTPVAISGGRNHINAALVGTSGDGIIVSCRGTLAPAASLPSVLDWIQDVFLSTPRSVDGLPGKVHSGFYMATKSIWKPLLKEIYIQLDAAGPDTGLYITGHSKGGGMASILAMLLNNESDLPTPKVYTYASPKPGNADFAQAYNAVIQQESYENYLDLVPLLPPSDSIINLFTKIPLLGDLFRKAQGWDYTPVGKRYYIEKNGLVVPNTSFLEDIRIGEIIYNLIKEDTKFIIEAHCHLCQASDCAGGYMKATCKQEICNQSEKTHLVTTKPTQ